MRKIEMVVAGLALTALAACAKPQPKEFTFPELNFAATFQAPPKVTDTPASADGSRPRSVMVESNAHGLDFAVNVTDASQATGSTDEMLDAAPQAIAQSLGVDVGPMIPASVGHIHGREVRFDKDQKPVMRMRFFFAGDKFYEVSADSSKGPDVPAVKAFLDSFRLLEGPGAGKGVASAPTNAAPAANSAPAANAAPTSG